MVVVWMICGMIGTVVVDVNSLRVDFGSVE